MRKPFLTSEHKKFIQENRLKISGRDMAKIFGCNHSVVGKYMRQNGLSVPKEVSEKFRIQGMRTITTFTPEMDITLKENYLTMPVKHLAQKIGKSFTAVMTRLRQLGLEIPKEIREERKRIGQIKPGTPGWNKGKKQKDYMSAEKIAKTAKTRFKKGQKPPNTAEGNGVISIRKNSQSGINYKYIRVKMAVWKQYHHFIWEKHHGPIPKDHCIRFKNGNSLDCSIENLELITRAENLEKNWHQYPDELKQVIKLTNKIQKQL